MLGQLFHRLAPSGHSNAATTATTTSSSLDSVTEEAHTRNLLFPDPSQLNRPQNHAFPLINGTAPPSVTTTGRYDNVGEVDLDHIRDLRILIAQDSTASQPKAVLYDSKPPPAKPVQPKNASSSAAVPPVQGRARLNSTASRSSVNGMPLPKPASRTQSFHTRQASDGFDSSRSRRSTDAGASAFQRARLRTSSLTVVPSAEESTQSRLAREGEEEVKNVLDCMFGSAVLSYKGPSTKLHVVPHESRSTEHSAVNSPSSNTEASSSFGRTTSWSRRGGLSQSYSPGYLSPRQTPSTSAATVKEPKASGKRTLLITRMFSVSLPESNARYDATPTVQSSYSTTDSYFPAVGALPSNPKAVKQRKTPMYAVALLFQLPVPNHSAGRAHRGGARMTSPIDGSGSFPSSFESEKQAGWTFLDSAFGSDSIMSVAPYDNVDDLIDVILQRWDVIARTLAYLESTARERILEQLKALDLASPQLTPSMIALDGNEAVIARQKQAIRASQRSLQLPPDALHADDMVKHRVAIALSRVIRGIKTPRVITGQGRWGVWREEARWVGRWAGGKEQNFFFFNLLTAFLGSHTEWLNIIGPAWYRRRYQQQQKQSQSEDLALPCRTVILCGDKMAARRLIFLLTAFLPGSINSQDGGAAFPASNTGSLRGYSSSPPSAMPLREVSLRRKINKRGAINRANSGLGGYGRASSVSLHSVQEGGSPDEPAYSGKHHFRTRSANPYVNTATIAIPSSNGTSNRNSAATTSTVTPTATIPVPHFAMHRNSKSGTVSTAEARRGSTDSLASANLLHTLKRNGSSNASNMNAETGRGWGSLISGFWSSRRDSSAVDTDITIPHDDSAGSYSVQQKLSMSSSSVRPTSLSQMVSQVSNHEEATIDEDEQDESAINDGAGASAPSNTFQDADTSRPGKPIPERPKTFETPLRMSVDENDGVVDVEIPTSNFFGPSSFGSPIQSPSLGGFMSGSSFDGGASTCSHTSTCPFANTEPETPVNVAGWLNNYHEDFALQAVRPYASLEDEIKRSMSAEPTPLSAIASSPGNTPGTDASAPIDKWVDVTTTLIADCQTFSIKRIRLRRHIKLASAAKGSIQPQAPTPYGYPASSFGEDGSSHLHAAQRSQYGNPYTTDQLTPYSRLPDSHIEEEFIEEPIMDMDGTLADAIERVLVQSGPPSHIHSTASSRSSSRLGIRGGGGAGGDRRAVSDAAAAYTSGHLGGHSSHSHHPSGTLEVPRGECKKTVIGALEEVVRSVTAERSREEQDLVDTSTTTTMAAGGGTAASTALSGVRASGELRASRSRRASIDAVGLSGTSSGATESTLREGVRRWLTDIEEGSLWAY